MQYAVKRTSGGGAGRISSSYRDVHRRYLVRPSIQLPHVGRRPTYGCWLTIALLKPGGRNLEPGSASLSLPLSRASRPFLSTFPSTQRSCTMAWYAPFSYVSQVAGLATRSAERMAPTTTKRVPPEDTELVSVHRREYERGAPIPPFDDQHLAYPPTRVPHAFQSSSHSSAAPPALPVASSTASSDDDSGYASAPFDWDSSDSSDEEYTTSSLDDLKRDRARLSRNMHPPSPATSQASTRRLPVSSPRPYNPDDSDDDWTMPVKSMQNAGQTADVATTHLRAAQGVAPVASSSFSVHPLEDDVTMEDVSLVPRAFSNVTRTAARGAPPSILRIPALASAVRTPAPAAVATTRVHAAGHAATNTTAPRAAVALARPRYPLPPPVTGKRTHAVEEESALHKKARVVKSGKQARRMTGRSNGQSAVHADEDAMQVDEQKVTAPAQKVSNASSSRSSSGIPRALGNSFAGKGSVQGATIKTLEIVSSEDDMVLKVVDEHDREHIRPPATLAHTNVPRLVLTDTIFAPHVSSLSKTGELASIRELYVRVTGPYVPSPLWVFEAQAPVLRLPKLERVVLLAEDEDALVSPSVRWDRVVHLLGSLVARCPSRKPDVEIRKVTVKGWKTHLEELEAVGVFSGLTTRED
ncbi:hypothetical protein EXIGLDRAFT_298838 [Exidia glandulosa HHB12029]|uniref:Uncharacterized protein n=1 Tax=Exidia glandulosa HHB12029 TaxID=1314781 RepID=A0A165M040_EXIGL|nr:hypothetical protein EXIGLDRAFT_298838 [Exidia glandulosa HHB12029]